MGQDIAPPNQQNNPHQAPQRHVHPLPPKPPVGLPPPHTKGEDVKTHYDTQQPAKRRRSRSPLRGESSGMSWSDHIDKRLKHGRDEDTLRDDVAPL